MKSYRTCGTAGDTYTTLCKLVGLDRKEQVTCLHEASVTQIEKNSPFRTVVQDIFTILSNVKVNFVPEGKWEKMTEPIIQSYPPNARNGSWTAPADPPEIKMTWFPEFGKLADISKFGLPSNYTVLSPCAGGQKRLGYNWRVVTLELLNLSFSKAKYPIVLLGQKHTFSKYPGRVLNLIGQTSTRQAIEITRHAKQFVGMQGFLLFVALSSKVTSTAYTEKVYEQVVRNARIIGEWAKYCKEIVPF